eukprot:2079432-Pyramimonas_sp.AAC.1
MSEWKSSGPGPDRQRSETDSYFNLTKDIVLAHGDCLVTATFRPSFSLQSERQSGVCLFVTTFVHINPVRTNIALVVSLPIA